MSSAPYSLVTFARMQQEATEDFNRRVEEADNVESQMREQAKEMPLLFGLSKWLVLREGPTCVVLCGVTCSNNSWSSVPPAIFDSSEQPMSFFRRRNFSSNAEKTYFASMSEIIKSYWSDVLTESLEMQWFESRKNAGKG
jgi:hypothetical protein